MFFLVDGSGSRDPLLGNMNEPENHEGIIQVREASVHRNVARTFSRGLFE